MACEKNEKLEIDGESQSIVDNCVADQEFMALPALIYNALSRTSSAGAAENPTRDCAAFRYADGDTLDFNPAPVYRFDMMQSPCVLNDNKSRKGELLLKLSSSFDLPDTRCTITLSNYEAGGWYYKCDSIVMIGRGNSANYSGYRLLVYNGSCTNNRFHIAFSCDRQIAVYPGNVTQAEGSFTSFFGYSAGINRVGGSFETEVLNDVVKNNSCPYFTSGTLRIVPEGFKQRLVDYGEGGCDDLGFFTVNENTVAFKLK